MGKSPGKWIKTLLFGKKASKSNFPKGRVVVKSANEEEISVSAKLPASDLIVDPSLASQPVSSTGAGNGVNLNLEKGAASKLPNDGVIIASAKQDEDAQTITNLGSPNDPERIRLEQAATKAQAAFRGYLARRAFWALRGVIRLQALVRGHLVRRQAVATLHCMLGIVKFQTLVRGQKDAKYMNSFETITSTQPEKLSENAFVRKLLASSPTAMPLRLQYGPGEPNSAWEWLKCWTKLHFWEDQSQHREIADSNSQAKHGFLQKIDTIQGRSKRSVQRVPTANVENGSFHSTSESEKFKRNLRKVSSHPVETAMEHSQNEIEKVKHNLRKISDSTMEASDRAVIDTEKPKRTQRKALNSAVSEVLEKGINDYAEKTRKEMTLAETKQFVIEASPITPATAELVDELHDYPAIDLQTKESNGDTPGIGKGFSSKDDQSSDENQKPNNKRASLPEKQHYQENGLHNTPRVPSYMAATESAKAKLRAQGSPTLGQDEAEKNVLTRRHSLPSSTNGKLSSLSPRAQKLVQAGGKGGIRNEKSLLSSRDYGKVIQPGWRR